MQCTRRCPLRANSSNHSDVFEGLAPERNGARVSRPETAHVRGQQSAAVRPVVRRLRPELKPVRARRSFGVGDFRLTKGIVGIGPNSRLRGGGHHLTRQLQSFTRDRCGEEVRAGDVAARPIEASDEAQFDRVAAASEYDGNGGGCRLGFILPASPSRQPQSSCTARRVGARSATLMLELGHHQMPLFGILTRPEKI